MMKAQNGSCPVQALDNVASFQRGRCMLSSYDGVSSGYSPVNLIGIKKLGKLVLHCM